VSSEHNPNHKGNAAELAIAAEAAKFDLSVLKPLTEHERYDLVLGIGGELFRVQCKWAPCHDGVIQVRLRSSYHSPTRGYVTSTYGSEEVDLVAIYCGDLDRCYLLPPTLFVDRHTAYLRIAEVKNNQRAALNWAAQYEFSGAVAQLAERFAGSEEVRGSIPLSSIDPRGAGIDVGAHEFRNHFGYYMERAAAGCEITVSRRGHPYVRMRGFKDPTQAADE
jgi:hypothetical protein